MDIVIFGISGDLAEKKLVPALISLSNAGKIPKDTRLIGFSRKEKTLDHHVELPFPYEQVIGSYSNNEDFLRLKGILRPKVKQLFYLAVPPEAARHALASLSAAGLVQKEDAPDSRLILIEKPFGKGYADAASLIEFINSAFAPSQCLKIDHYAGKREIREIERSGVRNHFEAERMMFEILETATVEHRSGFYDSAGALRDVGQNHLLYMVAAFFRGNGSREDVLSRLEPDPDISKYRFGHYEGYEKIETFFSIPAILHLDTDHSSGVGITLRSGKGLSKNAASLPGITLSSGISAYENILLDAIEGNHQGFLSDTEVLAAWSFIEKVEVIKEAVLHRGDFFSYPVGSDADSLL